MKIFIFCMFLCIFTNIQAQEKKFEGLYKFFKPEPFLKLYNLSKLQNKVENSEIVKPVLALYC